ncbi:hypothetical protein AB0I94_06585 [Streptomyces sp. NPDC050147]
MQIALYLPGADALPRWVQITVGVVVLGLFLARLWLHFRRRR